MRMNREEIEPKAKNLIYDFIESKNDLKHVLNRHSYNNVKREIEYMYKLKDFGY